jgi:hypothetical protein
MLARYIIVNEVEKENAEFIQGLMNAVQQKDAELTKAVDLLVQAYDDTLEALGALLTLKNRKPPAIPSASPPTLLPLPRTFPSPFRISPFWLAPLSFTISARWLSLTKSSASQALSTTQKR